MLRYYDIIKKKNLNIVNNKLFFTFYTVEKNGIQTNYGYYPLLNLINNTLDVRNTEIHINVEQKPM